jgi:hypothetical protein
VQPCRCCGLCGDFPAEDLKIVGTNAPPLASIRLCKHCQAVHSSYHDVIHEPLL